MYGKEDHGILTANLYCRARGYSQGFGGLALGSDAEGQKYLAALCYTFGVDNFADLKGKEGYLLYAFGFHNDIPVGIESKDTGKQFIQWRWAQETYPESEIVDPLQSQINELNSTVDWARRRYEEALDKLKDVVDEYTEW